RARPRRALPAFPTRRSSDLLGAGAEDARQSERGGLGQHAARGVLQRLHDVEVGEDGGALLDGDVDLTRDLDGGAGVGVHPPERVDRKSTRLNSSHVKISYAV